MVTKMSGQEIITKTLKFVISTNKKQSDVLEKITARHTFAVRKVIEIISSEGIPARREVIRKLTQTSRYNPVVKYDLKLLTGLSYRYLSDCIDTAIWLYTSYQALLRKWEDTIYSASSNMLNRILADIELNTNNEILSTHQELSSAIDSLAKTKLWGRIRRKKPSLPFESQKHNPKKIPIFINANNFLFAEDEEGLFSIRIATLKKYQRLPLQLQGGDYHRNELQNATVTGGQLIKNISKNRWEFHAIIRKSLPQFTITNNKKAILGIDLGVVNAATMVVLLENEQLSSNQFYFFKESHLKHKMLGIRQRRKKLQGIISRTSGLERKKALKELYALQGRNQQLSKEICCIIAKKIGNIARSFLEKEIEVHIALGKLKGLRVIATKGDGKGKKYRNMISKFPFKRLTELIILKCLEVGVQPQNISVVKESWTSKTCHKCESVNSTRSGQGNFRCLDCGLKYNADANGAINIALRYLLNKSTQKNQSSTLSQIKLIFLPRKSEVGSELLSTLGIGDVPTTEKPIVSWKDSTGVKTQLKVDEVENSFSGDEAI